MEDSLLGVPVFSRLPNELIHYIFNICLTSECAIQTCRSLCLVASWTRQFALPYLYSTQVFRFHPTLIPPVGNGYRSPFYPVDKWPLVRNVWFNRGFDHIVLITMQLYTGILNLSICGDDFYRILIWMIDAIFEPRKHLQRTLYTDNISCTPRELYFHPDSSGLLFTQIMMMLQRPSFCDQTSFIADFLGGITHLFLPLVKYSQYSRVNTFMQRFPRLTHLAIPFISLDGIHLEPLLRLPSLKMLVLAIPSYNKTIHDLLTNTWVQSRRKVDSRVYIVSHQTDIDAAKHQWEEDARRNRSVWQRAVQYTEDWERDQNLG
jgi:hypothetical protein